MRVITKSTKDWITKIKVNIKRKDDCGDLPLPAYATEGSSGMDLYADVKGQPVIRPGDIKLVSCGVYLSIPHGYEAEIRPRSGLALRHGITLVNTPGTIDSDYRGLVSVILTNLGREDFIVKRGDRIAQMVFKKIAVAELVVIDELDETVRSAGGFGHTGI
ncbi:MAG: dUTP diphosphatase [Candidatus Omnitrophica bacterium]|nr:dUTP diphosphatase [Candidatus Omnitrophota bacterium]